MTISNFEIANVCAKHKIKVKLTDILNKDQLEFAKCIKSMNLIINFAKEGEEGTHFVALLIRGEKALYFDSFGAYPLNEVLEYCKKHSLKLAFSNYIIQNIKSTNCGIFDVGLIKYVGSSNKLYEKANEYINLFVTDTKNNDAILLDYLHCVGIDDFA